MDRRKKNILQVKNFNLKKEGQHNGINQISKCKRRKKEEERTKEKKEYV